MASSRTGQAVAARQRGKGMAAGLEGFKAVLEDQCHTE